MGNKQTNNFSKQSIHVVFYHVPWITINSATSIAQKLFNVILRNALKKCTLLPMLKSRELIIHIKSKIIPTVQYYLIDSKKYFQSSIERWNAELVRLVRIALVVETRAG